MLIISAEIEFFNLKNSNNSDGISANIILRPAFNFGEGLLVSGNIINDGTHNTYLFNDKYNVRIEFPTIDGEAYEVILPLLQVNVYLNIQTGAKIIGKAKLLEFKYI